MRILVVEDKRKLANTPRRGLEEEGYAVDVVYDGFSAKLRLETSADEHDLVLLEVMLPGIDERGLHVIDPSTGRPATSSSSKACSRREHCVLL